MCDKRNLRSACAYAQSDQSLCLSLEYSTSVKLLTEHHLEFLSLKGGCAGSSESTLVKNATLWEITCRCSYMRHVKLTMQLLKPFYAEWNFPSLSIWRIHFEFKRCWVVFYNFIQILKDNSPGKYCRTWSDTVFCGVWSCLALFADVP